MPRVLEPELMDDAEQARAYSEADFAAPHDAFVAMFGEQFPDALIAGEVLDLGCGPADVAVRFARQYPQCHILGLDGAQAMLDYGRTRLVQEKMTERIDLVWCHFPVDPWGYGQFETIISNSLLHHLHDPQVLWHTLKSAAAPGAEVFIMDLMRPDAGHGADSDSASGSVTEANARSLMDKYAADEPPILQQDFYNSLLAAFTVDEVREQLSVAGIKGLAVKAVSDRHLIVSGRVR